MCVFVYVCVRERASGSASALPQAACQHCWRNAEISLTLSNFFCFTFLLSFSLSVQLLHSPHLCLLSQNFFVTLFLCLLLIELVHLSQLKKPHDLLLTTCKHKDIQYTVHGLCIHVTVIDHYVSVQHIILMCSKVNC